MLDLFNLPTPQGCDIQTFYGNGSEFTWIKPRGVSHVYMMLIGAGAYNVPAGSGSVTVWYGAAQNVPDNLVVRPSRITTATQQDSTVSYRAASGLVTLLTGASGAGSGGAGAAGVSTAANQFAASGYYQSIAGQAGVNGAVSASTTTFLSGGGGSTVTANYGYRFDNGGNNANGYFQLQPIIVGVGANCTTSGTFKPGIGCGTGANASGYSSGLILIASW